MNKRNKAQTQDIARFMDMSDRQLNFVLAAWCRYRCADGYLVELLVDHVHRLDQGFCRDMKSAYFESALEYNAWLADYAPHEKAIALGICKYEESNTPALVKGWLDMATVVSRSVTKAYLKEKLSENIESTKKVRV